MSRKVPGWELLVHKGVADGYAGLGADGKVPAAQLPAGSSGTDANAIHVNVAAEISAITAKTTPVDADVTVIEDSAATPTAFVKKSLSWAQIKSTLKTYFDGLYTLANLGGLGLHATADLAANLSGTPALPDGTMATTQTPGSNNTKLATCAYVDAIIAAADAMVFKGVIDCSGNPNYPAADRGATYRVSVAGKIGGASGTNVEAGDLLICLTDGTVAGTQAAVGASWTIAQANLDGAVIGPASAVGDHVVFFDSTSGKLVKDSGLTLSGSNTGDSATPAETATTIGALINGAGAKATPIDADLVGFVNTEAANILVHATWTNIKAFLKTYFDSIYLAVGGAAASCSGNAATATKWGAYAAIAGPSQARTITLADADQTLANLAGTQTLTNKRVTPRVSTVPSNDATLDSGNAEYNVDIADVFIILALAQATNFGVPGGTPTDGQGLLIRVKDNATAHNLTFTGTAGGFRAGTDLALPTTTVLSKTMYMNFIFNAADGLWDYTGNVGNI